MTEREKGKEAGRKLSEQVYDKAKSLIYKIVTWPACSRKCWTFSHFSLFCPELLTLPPPLGYILSVFSLSWSISCGLASALYNLVIVLHGKWRLPLRNSSLFGDSILFFVAENMENWGRSKACLKLNREETLHVWELLWGQICFFHAVQRSLDGKFKDSICSIYDTFFNMEPYGNTSFLMKANHDSCYLGLSVTWIPELKLTFTLPNICMSYPLSLISFLQICKNLAKIDELIVSFNICTYLIVS